MTVIPYSLSPLVPNWSKEYSIEKSFKTDIAKSYAGREQRRSVLYLPRKRIEFTVDAAGAAFNRLDTILNQWTDQKIVLPEAPRYVKLTLALVSGNVVATVDDTPFWIAEGAYLVFAYQGRQELFTVDSVAGDEVTLTGSSADDWPIGTKVYLGLLGILGQTHSLTLHTNRVGSVNIEFLVWPGSEIEEELPAAPATFNGRELWMQKFNWANAPKVTILSDRNEVDFGRMMEVFTPVPFRTRTATVTYLARTFDQAEEYRQFFERMKGQLNEFYVPSWTPDIQPKADLESGESTLTVEGTEFHRDFNLNTLYKAVIVFLRDGTTIMRPVAGIATAAGDSVMTITGTWPADIELADIRMISWLFVARFATDTLPMTWHTNGVAEVDFTFKTLESL